MNCKSNSKSRKKYMMDRERTYKKNSQRKSTKGGRKGGRGARPGYEGKGTYFDSGPPGPQAQCSVQYVIRNIGLLE